jgi:hypothetical protein
MQDQDKMNIATARLKGFVRNLSGSPDEDQILEYHDIIKLFEEVCKQDLSQFRIAADQIKPKAGTTMASSGWRWKTRHSKKDDLVDFVYFRGQVKGLIAHLMTVLGNRPS